MIVLWQFKPKSSPVAVLVIGRWGWCRSLRMIVENHEIYGGGRSPPCRHSQNKIAANNYTSYLNISGTIHDRTIILMSKIWSSKTRNSKMGMATKSFLCLPLSCVFLSEASSYSVFGKCDCVVTSHVLDLQLWNKRESVHTPFCAIASEVFWFLLWGNMCLDERSVYDVVDGIMPWQPVTAKFHKDSLAGSHVP